MRSYILTKKEHEIIKLYLNEGKKMEGFAMLKHRIDKNYKMLISDIRISREFLTVINIKKERERRIKNP